MSDATLHERSDPVGRVSRRRFLCRAAACGTAAWLGNKLTPTASAQHQTASAVRSDVFELSMEGSVSGNRAHPVLVREMLEQALRLAGNTSRSGETWRRWIGDDDVIALKFNRSGAGTMGTVDGVAGALVASLLQADFSPEKIMLLEVPQHLTKELGTRPAPQGWADQVYGFGSGEDQFRAALDDASVLINVPFLKTHNLAGSTILGGKTVPGMTGCLKNLSHGLVKHPARYHANGCSPFIGDIVASQAIRPKLKLNIMNALRVMYEKGPRASEDYVQPAHLLIVSVDPVAADTCGLYWLNRIRKKRNLPLVGGAAGQLDYLVAAQESGVGMADMNNIRQHFTPL